MEVGTLRFWVGSTRYRYIRRSVVAGQNLPLVNFARIADLNAIREGLDISPIHPLPVINLDSEDDDESPPVDNVWHEDPVPDSEDINRSNHAFLQDIGEFHGDFAAFMHWLNRKKNNSLYR